jgi:hypothetical protein
MPTTKKKTARKAPSKFVTLRERNSWEGETWDIHIQEDGNEKAIERLSELLKRYSPDGFSILEKRLSEREVDTLVDNDTGPGYTSAHSKLSRMIPVISASSRDELEGQLYKCRLHHRRFAVSPGGFVWIEEREATALGAFLFDHGLLASEELGDLPPETCRKIVKQVKKLKSSLKTLTDSFCKRGEPADEYYGARRYVFQRTFDEFINGVKLAVKEKRTFVIE